MAGRGRGRRGEGGRGGGGSNIHRYPLLSCQVLEKHCHVLARGLVVDAPSINHILTGDIPVVTNSSEQVFLRDFIESKADTPGGRLAR